MQGGLQLGISRGFERFSVLVGLLLLSQVGRVECVIGPEVLRADGVGLSVLAKILTEELTLHLLSNLMSSICIYSASLTAAYTLCYICLLSYLMIINKAGFTKTNFAVFVLFVVIYTLQLSALLSAAADKCFLGAG